MLLMIFSLVVSSVPFLLELCLFAGPVRVHLRTCLALLARFLSLDLLLSFYDTWLALISQPFCLEIHAITFHCVRRPRGLWAALSVQPSPSQAVAGVLFRVSFFLQHFYPKPL